MKLRIVSPPSPYKGKRLAIISKKNHEILGDYVKILSKDKEIILRTAISHKIKDDEIGISRLFNISQDEVEVLPSQIEESKEVIIKSPLKIDGFDQYIKKILLNQPVYEGEKVSIPFLHGKIEIKIEKVDKETGFIGKSTIIVLI